MCGIVGYVGPRPVVPVLIDGLRRLEYRGYDSAGIAVVGSRALEVRRSAGKLANLEALVRDQPLVGESGIGHTRWATHGRPTEANAHPHRDCHGRLVVVHNGIVENFLELKRHLAGRGHEFRSETDTEVVAHLIEEHGAGDGIAGATRRALAELRGLFALVVMSADEPGTVIAVRHGPPVVIGMGHDEYLVASDVTALLSHTRDVVFLAEEEMAVVTPSGVEFMDFGGRKRDRSIEHVDWDPAMAEKAGFHHFMLKEIHEQPAAVRQTLAGRLSSDPPQVTLECFDDSRTSVDLERARRVAILACGTSWHAGLVGKFLIETLAGLPVDVDYASEFRYRRAAVDRDTLAVAITQSGETADTLGALREARRLGASSVAICNVVGSMATREADATIHTRAGPEIGVASTKAFTTQVVALTLLAVAMGRARGTVDADTMRRLVAGIEQLPALLEDTLQLDGTIARMAAGVARKRSALFLARGINYPIALEGALKLKEISYIHAEGYPAGEMKHGPIALIDQGFPVVAIAAAGPVFEKTLGNVQESRARGARLIVLTNRSTAEECRAILNNRRDVVLTVPDVDPLLAPVLFALPLQLLAYHVAVARGCDVDQPRNLAKSVTVE